MKIFLFNIQYIVNTKNIKILNKKLNLRKKTLNIFIQYFVLSNYICINILLLYYQIIDFVIYIKLGLQLKKVVHMELNLLEYTNNQLQVLIN